MEIDYDKIWSDKWGDMQKYGPIHRHRRRIAKKMLAGIDFQDVLDIGCGEGSNLLFLKNLSAKVKLSGVDISDIAVNEAKKFLPDAKFYIFDCQKQKLNQQFDLVFCSDVIEHLVDDKRAIKNIYDMTGGYFYIATVQGKMRKFEKNIGHIRNYGYGELAEILVNARFTIYKKIEWGWPLYSPLYRNILDTAKGQQTTRGKYGMMKKLLCFLMYYAFFFNNLFKNGDMIFILAKR